MKTKFLIFFAMFLSFILLVSHISFVTAQTQIETTASDITEVTIEANSATSTPADEVVDVPEQDVDPGITPDSVLYGIDRALEQVTLALTIGNERKVDRGLENARERLAEVKSMIERKKLRHAERARQEHEKELARVKEKIAKLEEKEDKGTIKKIVEFEKRIARHKAKIVETENEIKIKIRVKTENGDLTEAEMQEIQASAETLLKAFGENAGKVEIEIKTKEDKIKVKLRKKFEKEEKLGEEEAEKKAQDEFNAERNETLILEKRREKARENIIEAEEDLDEIKAKIAQFETQGEISDHIKALIREADDKLVQAKNAFSSDKFGAAFGQAQAADVLIRNASKQFKKFSERLEKKEEKEKEKEGNKTETDEDADADADDEIKIKIKALTAESLTRVKVKLGDDELDFELNTINKDEIVKEISARTGLTQEQVLDSIQQTQQFRERTDRGKKVEEARARVKLEKLREEKQAKLRKIKDEKESREILKEKLDEKAENFNKEREEFKEKQETRREERKEKGEGDRKEEGGK